MSIETREVHGFKYLSFTNKLLNNPAFCLLKVPQQVRRSTVPSLKLGFLDSIFLFGLDRIRGFNVSIITFCYNTLIRLVQQFPSSSKQRIWNNTLFQPSLLFSLMLQIT
jgi:hypothetical protein